MGLKVNIYLFLLLIISSIAFASEWDIPAKTDASWLSHDSPEWRAESEDPLAGSMMVASLNDIVRTTNDDYINPIETYMRHLGEYTNCPYPCPRYELKADGRVYTGGPNYNVNIVGMTEFNGGNDFAILWDNANMAFYHESAIAQYGDDTGSHYYYIRAMPGEPRGIAEVSDSFPGPLAYAARTIILFYNYDGTLAVNESGDPYFINVPQDIIDITYDGERDLLIVNLDRSTDECYQIDQNGNLLTRVSRYCNREYEIRYLNFKDGIMDVFNRELLFNVVNMATGAIYSEDSAETFLIELVNRSGTNYGGFYTRNHMAAALGLGFYSYPKFGLGNNLGFLDYLERDIIGRIMDIFAEAPGEKDIVGTSAEFVFNNTARFTTVSHCDLTINNNTVASITDVDYGLNSFSVGNLSLGNHTWHVLCQDALNRTSVTDEINFTVALLNTPPVLNSLENITIPENSLLQVVVSANDTEGDNLTFYYSTPLNKSGAWKIGYEDAGIYNIMVTVSDGEFNVSGNFTINVTNVNRAPVLFPIDDILVPPTGLIKIVVHATDPENDTLNYSINDTKFNQDENIFTYQTSEIGVFKVLVSVSDGELTDNTTVQINVSDNLWILHLVAMANTTKEQDNYSGAAVAQIILNFEREAAGNSSLTQDEIYGYARQYMLENNSNVSDLDAKAMMYVLGHYDPYDNSDPWGYGFPYTGYNYGIESFNHTEEGLRDYMRSILHWMSWNATKSYWWNEGELAEEPNAPAALPLYGDYNHWVAVNGGVANAHPIPDMYGNPWEHTNITVYGFWLTDPDSSGIGHHTYVTAEEAANTYFRPLVSNDKYNGKYVQVAEPPLEDFDITIAEPVIPELQARTLSTMSGDNSRTVFNWGKIVDSNLFNDKSFVRAYTGTQAIGEIKVRRLDTGKSYSIIPFVKNGLAYVTMIIDTNLKYFKQASWVDDGTDYMSMTEDDIRELLHDDYSLEIDSLELVWEPGLSSSPFKPAWLYANKENSILLKDDGSVEAKFVNNPPEIKTESFSLPALSDFKLDLDIFDSENDSVETTVEGMPSFVNESFIGEHDIKVTVKDAYDNVVSKVISLLVTAPLDGDNDTIADYYDNCVEIANTNQQDSDGDGIGNVCDSTPYPPQPKKETSSGGSSSSGSGGGAAFWLNKKEEKEPVIKKKKAKEEVAQEYTNEEVEQAEETPTEELNRSEGMQSVTGMAVKKQKANPITGMMILGAIVVAGMLGYSLIWKGKSF